MNKLFREAGIDSTNTAEQDIHLITAYGMNMMLAQTQNTSMPIVTDQLADAVERVRIRADACGEKVTLAFGLAAAVEEKIRQRTQDFSGCTQSRRYKFYGQLNRHELTLN